MLPRREAVALLILLATSTLHSTEGAKILALMNLASPSHYIFNRVLLVALAERGHQVTVISPDMEKKTVPNLTSILLEDIYTSSKEDFDYEYFQHLTLFDQVFAIFEWGSSICEKELKTKGAQKLLNYSSSEKFDLIISELGWGECFFGFITKFGSPPVIATSGVGVAPWLSPTMGNPENPSYMPNFLLPYTEHMDFGERLYNFVIHNLVVYLYQHRHLALQESIARQHFKEDLPPFLDIARNFSLVLVNLVFGLDGARPLQPNIIPIGGMHIKTKPDPLPKDLQKFLDEAKDGFIFFSLGSNLRSKDISEQKRKALLEAFGELPQRILWKFESDQLPDLPPNVKIGKWLPQSDILAHPNIRMFITHCGMMSTMEATYRGVPVVGIPFFLDQKVNLKKFITKGVGVELDYASLTKGNVLKAVRTILDNDSYQKNMKKLSSVFKDQPQSALDRAVFWTEYVIRHGGAPHLRPASLDLYWYQYLLLDVLAVILIAILLTLMVLYFMCLATYNVFRRFVFAPSKKVKQT